MSFNETDPAVLSMKLDAIDDRLRGMIRRAFCYFDDCYDVFNAASRLSGLVIDDFEARAGAGHDALIEIFLLLQSRSDKPDLAYCLSERQLSYLAYAIVVRCKFKIGDIVSVLGTTPFYKVVGTGVGADGETRLLLALVDGGRPFTVLADNCQHFDASGPPNHPNCRCK